MIESAKANGRNPYVYLRDVLTWLPVTKAKDIDSLLPHVWQPGHQPGVFLLDHTVALNA